MIKFKRTRISGEWDELDTKLRKILEFLYLFMEVRYNQDITITELIRTQEEQDILYGKKCSNKDTRERYKKSPWKSVHQYGRGADIRTFDWKREWIDDIMSILNKIPYDENRPHKQTAIYHDIGTGEHIHIQTWIT